MISSVHSLRLSKGPSAKQLPSPKQETFEMSESDPPPWTDELSLVERLQRELVTKLELVQTERLIEAARDQVSNLILPSNVNPKIRQIFLKKVEEMRTLLDEFLTVIGTTISVLRKETAAKCQKDVENLLSPLKEAIRRAETLTRMLNTNDKSEKVKAGELGVTLKKTLRDIEQFLISYIYLEDKLRRVIIPQSVLVRRLKGDKDKRPQYEEESKKLLELKGIFFKVTDKSWSEVVEEGPAILTTNAVAGIEIIPELREITKELRRRNILRYNLVYALY